MRKVFEHAQTLFCLHLPHGWHTFDGFIYVLKDTLTLLNYSLITSSAHQVKLALLRITTTQAWPSPFLIYSHQRIYFVMLTWMGDVVDFLNYSRHGSDPFWYRNEYRIYRFRVGIGLIIYFFGIRIGKLFTTLHGNINNYTQFIANKFITKIELINTCWFFKETLSLTPCYLPLLYPLRSSPS